MAVDNSIVEILPAVIDRAVTIAKITTTQIVIKDFAYDGDYIRLLRAADLIV
jgi:CCR4-NOT transcription complex subunit 1